MLIPERQPVSCDQFQLGFYLSIINFENDAYHCKTVKTLKEDQELVEAGFEFVTERDGIKIYRKRK